MKLLINLFPGFPQEISIRPSDSETNLSIVIVFPNDGDARIVKGLRENTTFVEQYLVNHVYTLVVPPWYSTTTILIESANLTDKLDARNKSTQGALAMVRMDEVDKGKVNRKWEIIKTLVLDGIDDTTGTIRGLTVFTIAQLCTLFNAVLKNGK
ncbi:unnamed protein product, partial [Mesorhabditis belari]|uniref:Uncharacterized protein n=1 Tax=Mesorhabditis belari TaxID=2138241 RepID=A0AAF3F959_9BILA